MRANKWLILLAYLQQQRLLKASAENAKEPRMCTAEPQAQKGIYFSLRTESANAHRRVGTDQASGTCIAIEQFDGEVTAIAV